MSLRTLRRFGVLAMLVIGVTVLGWAPSGWATSDYVVAEVALPGAGGVLRPMSHMDVGFAVCPQGFPESCRIAELLTVQFDGDDVGATHWVDSSNPLFATHVGRLTDGVAQSVLVLSRFYDADGVNVGSGAGRFYTGEPGYFGSQTGPNGIDLAGFAITRIGYRLDSLAYDPSLDMWTFSGAWLFEGTLASNALCKGDGWQTLKRSDGTAFKNQGDCIQYFYRES